MNRSFYKLFFLSILFLLSTSTSAVNAGYFGWISRPFKAFIGYVCAIPGKIGDHIRPIFKSDLRKTEQELLQKHSQAVAEVRADLQAKLAEQKTAVENLDSKAQAITEHTQLIAETSAKNHANVMVHVGKLEEEKNTFERTMIKTISDQEASTKEQLEKHQKSIENDIKKLDVQRVDLEKTLLNNYDLLSAEIKHSNEQKLQKLKNAQEDAQKKHEEIMVMIQKLSDTFSEKQEEAFSKVKQAQQLLKELEQKREKERLARAKQLVGLDIAMRGIQLKLNSLGQEMTKVFGKVGDLQQGVQDITCEIIAQKQEQKRLLPANPSFGFCKNQDRTNVPLLTGSTNSMNRDCFAIENID